MWGAPFNTTQWHQRLDSKATVTEICPNVATESTLQPLTGETLTHTGTANLKECMRNHASGHGVFFWYNFPVDSRFWASEFWRQQTTSSCEDGARLDVSAQGFWKDRHERAFFDVRVFNPLAPNNCKFSLNATYRWHENHKRRNYKQQVWEIKHGSFTPLVFSATGGMVPAATITYKRLASLLAKKSANKTTVKPSVGSDAA